MQKVDKKGRKSKQKSAVMKISSTKKQEWKKERTYNAFGIEKSKKAKRTKCILKLYWENQELCWAANPVRSF